MKNSKHTKGTWVADIQGSSSYVRCKQTSPFEKGSMVAKTWGESNANLIAAAPEMLEALESTLSCIDSWTNDDVVGPIIKKAQDAIKKARGV